MRVTINFIFRTYTIPCTFFIFLFAFYYVVSQCVRIAVWYFRISLSFKPLFNTIIINIWMGYAIHIFKLIYINSQSFILCAESVQFIPHCILHLLTHAVLIICCSEPVHTFFFCDTEFDDDDGDDDDESSETCILLPPFRTMTCVQYIFFPNAMILVNIFMGFHNSLSLF